MSAALPDFLYVRSVWSPSFAGTYRKVVGREVDNHPVWKQDGGQAWLFSEAGRWCVRESGPGEKKDDCAFLSPAHLGRSPAEVPHLGWTYESDDFMCGGHGNHETNEKIGFIVRETASPKLPSWAEQTSAWVKGEPSGTKQEQRRLASTTISVLEEELVARAIAHDACAAGCAAACFPDLEIHVGDERILANRDALVRASPFFATMLKSGGEMQEAATGQVRFPTADAQVVRRLLSLIYSKGHALSALSMTVSEQIDVLAQAAEWQCDDTVSALRDPLPQQLATAGLHTSLRVLKLASLQYEASSSQWRWATSRQTAIDRVAETCSGDLGVLSDLPLSCLESVLRSDRLDTVDDEGRVLRFVAEWVQKDEERLHHLPGLLKCVRFPFIRLLSLSDEEKVAMRFVHDHAGEQLQKHINEAADVQVGAKRVGHEPGGPVRKRHCCRALPEFDATKLGRVLCQSLFSTRPS